MQEQAVTATTPAENRRSTASWLRLLAILVGLGVLFFFGREAAAQIPRFAAWVQGLGAIGPAVFVAGYAIATVAMIPGSLLTLSAGAIFGLGEGIVYVFVAASTGATLAFLVSRYVARGVVEERVGENEKFEAIDRAVGEQGLKIVALLRLSPVFPFNLLNYALGLTNVRLRDYAIGHLAMLPGTLLYVYYGRVVGDVAALAGGAQVERGAAGWTVLIVGLAATLLVTTVVTRTARKALKDIADV